MKGTRLALLLLLASACSADAPRHAGPEVGVIYTFPFPDQFDVALAGTVTVLFSAPILSEALESGCTAGADGTYGSLCVFDDEGLVSGRTQIVGQHGRALEFSPDESLKPGTIHEVFVAPGLVAGGAANIHRDEALFRFTTRQPAPVRGHAARLIAINGERAELFAPGAASDPTLPIVDFATLQLLFDEPLDESTAILGETISLSRLEGGIERPVLGALLVQGARASIDPAIDMVPGATYRLVIGDGLLDAGGEPAIPSSSDFVPFATSAEGGLYPQFLDVAPVAEESNWGQEGEESSVPLNSLLLSSQLLGDQTIAVNNGTFRVAMAQPDLYETIIPFTLRRGQSISTESTSVRFGGRVSSGLATGEVHLGFPSDITGYILRNPFWPQETVPEGERAPLHIRLTYDVAISAQDERANAVLSQSMVGMQASGLATLKDGVLSFSNVTSIELDALGIAKAPGTLYLELASDPEGELQPDTSGPSLVRSSPEPGGTLPAISDSVQLIFDEPVRASTLASVQLWRLDGELLESRVETQGRIVVVTPRQPLKPGAYYEVALGAGLVDLQGNPLAASSADELYFSAPGLSTASPAPPMLLSSYPGAPCAVEDQSSLSGGRCSGGRPGDDSYLAGHLPANRSVQVVFDQPMAPSTLQLGSTCNSGAIRLERADSSGECEGVVEGTLYRRNRGFAFVPAAPWEEGTRYRLVLDGGSDSICNTGELCGVNGLPLNTDPLAGAGGGAGGGPLALTLFAGAPPLKDPMFITTALPVVDGNGNGKLDSTEKGLRDNAAAVAISGVSGVVTSSSIDAEDCAEELSGRQGCMYLSSDLLVSIQKVQSNCLVPTESSVEAYEHCLPIVLSPFVVGGTELNMDASILGLGFINDLKTGKIVLRSRQKGAPVRGYVVEDDTGSPEFIVALDMYMDAPDLSILGGLATHDLQSKPLSFVLRGPVDFRQDGRMSMRLQNPSAFTVDVRISVASVGVGSMMLEIPAGGMRMSALSPPPRGGER